MPQEMIENWNKLSDQDKVVIALILQGKITFPEKQETHTPSQNTEWRN